MTNPGYHTKERTNVTVRTGRSFVTGGTGFIGRHLIQRLLERSSHQIFVLVRKQSLPRFKERLTQWHADSTRVVPVIGDLTAPRLGLGSRQLAALRGRIGHFFHVASTC